MPKSREGETEHENGAVESALPHFCPSVQKRREIIRVR